MRKIKIAIIAHNCRTGGGLFGTLNLLKALKNVAQNEQFLLVCSAGYGYEELELPPNSEFYIYQGRHSPLERTWFERVTLPAIVRRYNPDVIFGAANISLARPSAPQAILVQQAHLFANRRDSSDTYLQFRLRIAALKAQVKSCLLSTGLILVQTPIVKKRFSEYYRYPEEKIKILRWPTPKEVKPISGVDIPPVFDKSSTDFYFLVLTRYLPHRNPAILIPLCKYYGEKIHKSKIKFIITVDKADHPHAVKFLNSISENRLGDIIINVGVLSRHDVLRYYSHSHVLWLPTMMETLCLPYLEAMAVGVPILAPDIDFARYVCGKAALFYDPWDMESIFENLMLIREDDSLRQKLVEQGKIEIADRSKFAEDWEEVASDVIRDMRILTEQK